MSLRYTKILVLLPWFSEHDAISNDAAWQTRFLRQQGVEAFLYAEGHSPKLANELISYDTALGLLKDPRVLAVYHHGVYWAQGEALLKSAHCKLVMKYHNITPPEFYRPYDRIATYATEVGRKQTREFLEKNYFSEIIGDSHYNINDLKEYGLPLPKTYVLAPFTQISDFDRVLSDQTVGDELKAGGRFNLLFVGRIVPNKGILHIIDVIRRYVEFYGSNIKITIIGGLGLSEDKYFKEIEDKINAARIGDHIQFLSKIEFPKIKAYFEYSDAFLLMSEHEGFCVPILESQYMGLPIIALGRSAVPETLGEQQLVLNDLNAADFASAIHRLKEDRSLREGLIAAGKDNYKRFDQEVLLNQMLSIFESLS